MAPRPEDCLDVLRTTDACREQARLRGLAEEGNGGNPGALDLLLTGALTPEIETLKHGRAGLFQVRDIHTLHVPYLMIYALLAYHVLGRTRGAGAERKVFRPFLFALDAVLPAYPEPWNFRDRGLWFSKQSLLPLDESALATGNFLRPRDMEAGTEGPARSWLGRRQLLEADIQPITFAGRVVRSHGWWIFRPFHCVLADTPMGSGWFLVDGQFRTLAGYLEDAEAERVLSRDWTPLDLERFRRPEVRPFPCRCPVCAGTLVLDERGAQQICPTCGRLLEPTLEGFIPRPYRALDRDALPWRAASGTRHTAWVPFWRFTGDWRLDREAFPTLEALMGRVLPPLPRRGAPPLHFPDALYFPAFDGWLYDQYDQWCFRTAEALGTLGAEPAEARFHLEERVGPKDLLIPPSEGTALYEGQLDGLVPALLPAAIQARLNPVLVKRLQEARFAVRTRDLVYVPIPRGSHGDLPDRLLGPGCAVDAGPLATGAYPPVLYRNVHRWKDRGRDAGRRAPAPLDDPDGFV